MKVEIKNYKRFNGHDGQGFEATLYIDGIRACLISDDGWGGEWNWDILPKGDKVTIEFWEKCKALPQIKFEYGDGEFSMLDMCPEIWIEDNLLQIADQKVQCRGKVLIMEDGKFYTMGKWDAKFAELIETMIHVRHPNAQLINGKPVMATI